MHKTVAVQASFVSFMSLTEAPGDHAIFESRALGSDVKFLYPVCVLRNFETDLTEVANKFALDLRTLKEPPPLPPISARYTIFKADKDTTLKESKTENDFYLIHALIETLATPIFKGFQAIGSDKTRLAELMPAMTQAMSDINLIMDHFNHYIRPDSFNAIRGKLSPASGAQSPLRFLDPLLYGTDSIQASQLALLNKIDTQTLPESHAPVLKQGFELLQSLDSGTLDSVGRHATKFLEKLCAEFPHFQVPAALMPSLEIPHDKVQTAAFVAERIRFKLNHYEIVNAQIPKALHGGENGTGGTSMKKFLIASIAQDMYHYCVLNGLLLDPA